MFHLISRSLLLLWRVRRVRLEPERIGAAIELAGPFEVALPFADAHLRKDRRIGDGGKHALAHQMIEAVPSGCDNSASPGPGSPLQSLSLLQPRAVHIENRWR